MLDNMSGQNVAEWQAFYNLELRGEDRADWRAGLLASMIANVNRGKNTDPYSPADFIPKWADRAEQYKDNDDIDDDENEVDEVDNSATLAMLATFQALTRAADPVVTPITETIESNVELISIPELPENGQ